LVDPALQGAHLASALLHRSLMVADEEGIKRSAGAMVRKGNVSEFFFKHLGVPEKTHTYGLYIKNI
jgi:N-acetylglutamate synthase-like GNAT family acetyltransferase